jgi:hypothetical protein
MKPEFEEFKKIPRLNRECFITEKIDGTNSQICITADGGFFVGSRSRWITPEDDNYGFARWCMDNKDELMKLGVGHHYGEWWGNGVQRGYNKKEKHFSLFNVSKWSDDDIRPKCCDVVPILYQGLFSTSKINDALSDLKKNGSKASVGFMKPEGVVIYHVAGNLFFKATIDKDEEPKSKTR